jgi:potassium inwardly-rectifying channel subfamily J
VTTSNTFSSTIGRVFDKVARRGRIFANRQQRRLVFKDGECNISKNQITSRKRHYFGDLFTTLLEMKWRYNLLLFGCVFVTSWLVFAFLWWIICIAHGDHLIFDQEDDEPSRCVANVYSFPTALLYSIETQHTIGYGSRMIEDKCLEAYLLLMIQSCFGVFIQSLLTGLVFAKLSRPKRRAKTMMFSKNGVICQRDGELFLLFRVGDMRKTPIIQTSIRAVMVKSRYTKEGELIPLCQYPLELETETSSSASENFILLSWPITVVHRINVTSPLWEISAEQLLEEQFEIVVILEGTIESTGMLAQMRTSYLPGEILWGHRFAPLFAFWKDKGQYQVDFTQFDATVPIETPECSAKDLYDQLARATSRGPHHKESLFMSNFLTIPMMPYKPPEESTSSNPSIFKRMRSSLKRRRSERDRRRNGSLPSISFNDSQTTDDLRDYAIANGMKLNTDEKEIDVDVSVESSRTENDDEETDQ